MNALAYHIARPAVVWSLHFIAIYALISAACAPRDLLSMPELRILALAVTLGAAALVSLWLITGIRRLRRTPGTDPARSLAQTAVWTAGISLMAIAVNLWPVATLSGCAG